ncbi:DDE-type integrase/transposase/recombinase [Rhizobium sp. 2MFCol3.1]|uniref:DDE-type integrase/transposase/recombinase n=1 Tax=Rhizobium sp. 2MFCol3.1 TaxID=1246459 RepID=UPI00037CCAEC|nr:DDE-type integrase/transposase/recombinase [Rhizobium sp. 2MFCol3.1]
MSKRNAKNVHVNADDRVTLDGRHHCYVDEFKQGIVLESDDGGPRGVFALTWVDVEDHLRTSRLVIDKGYYAQSAAGTPAKTSSMEQVSRPAKFRPLAVDGTSLEKATPRSLEVRPMDVLEMDDHKLDIRRVGLNLGFWNRLHPEVQARFENARFVWATVAMDACTRALCALHLTKSTPSVSSVIATLAMAVREKGAENVMPSGRPDAVYFDVAAPYVSSKFRETVVRLTGKPPVPYTQRPHFRGRVERMFRAISSGRLPQADVVGDNILLAENYNPTKHSQLTHQELLDLLALLIVGCYQNTPHRGLALETPLQRWQQLSQQCEGVAPPLSKDEYRTLFGVKMLGRVYANGISVAGIEYRSAQIAELHKAGHRVDADVLLNEWDISVISFRDPRDGRWYNAPAVEEWLENVTLAEWMLAIRQIISRDGRFDCADRLAVTAALHHLKRAVATL